MKIQISEQQYKNLKEGIRTYAATRKVKLYGDPEVEYAEPRFREHVREKKKSKK